MSGPQSADGPRWCELSARVVSEKSESLGVRIRGSSFLDPDGPCHENEGMPGPLSANGDGFEFLQNTVYEARMVCRA
jgi:hypothetical protein